jgi:hypothetical protein
MTENKGDLISREALKNIAYINKGNFNTVEGIREWIDNAPTIEWQPVINMKPLTSEEKQSLTNALIKSGLKVIRLDSEERPQGKWFDCIEAGTLKARHGDYVLYKVDFLLDNLTREVYIMEGARRMRGKEK